MGQQRYDPGPCWTQEPSSGQTKEQFVAEMLARPSSAAGTGSGPGRPQQARPRQQRQEDASSPAQGSRPQSSAASDVSIFSMPDLTARRKASFALN